MDVKHLYDEMVTLGGGVFRGVQPGFKQHPPLILFDDAGLPPNQSSTMCISPADLSADAVRRAILSQRERYGRTVAGAA